MEKKMTKKEMFGLLLELLETAEVAERDELKNFVAHEIEMIENKAEKAKTYKRKKTADVLKEQIYTNPVFVWIRFRKGKILRTPLASKMVKSAPSKPETRFASEASSVVFFTCINMSFDEPPKTSRYKVVPLQAWKVTSSLVSSRVSSSSSEMVKW